jgi:transketolase
LGKAKEGSTRDAYGKTLVELGKKDKDIVVLDADLSASTRTKLFAKEFPDRFFNMGVAEQDMIGTAAGLFLSGKKPYASTFALFATGRCWEQIRTSIAYPFLNVKIVATHGGITVGEDGPTHQATEDLAIMRSIPNMTVVIPADAIETAEAVKKMYEYAGPCYMRLSRSNTPSVYDENKCNFDLNEVPVLRDGKDITIIACGIMVKMALDASEELDKENISARVLNLHTLKPFNEEEVIKAAKETKYIITAEEHQIFGALSSAVSEVIVENYPVPIKFIGLRDTFAESGRPEELLVKYKLSAKDIYSEVKNLLKK